MRQMPSVTETIVPTLRASVTDLKLSIRCLMRSLISVALIAMCGSYEFFNGLSRQLVRDLVQLRPQRAVDDEIARLQHGSANERGIRMTLHADATLQPAFQRFRQRLPLPLVQGRRGRHRHIDDLFSFVF